MTEVRKTTKTVEVPSVEVKLIFDEKFWDEMIKSKPIISKEEGRKFTDGEFIMFTIQRLAEETETLANVCEQQQKALDFIMKSREELPSDKDLKELELAKNNPEHMFG
jgi:hypothetical protein